MPRSVGCFYCAGMSKSGHSDNRRRKPGDFERFVFLPGVLPFRPAPVVPSCPRALVFPVLVARWAGILPVSPVPGMKEEKKESQPRVWPWVLIAAVPLLYWLSIGPFFRWEHAARTQK